jgi:hypothetical protein
MVPDKKKRFFKRYFIQVRIKDTPEIYSEGKGRDNKLQKPVKHYLPKNLSVQVRNNNKC